MYYDAHNHLQDARLTPHREIILQELSDLPLSGAVVNGTREEDWEEVLQLAERNERLTPFVGLHPWHVNARSGEWENKLRTILERRRCGIGEIGLDRWVEGFDAAAQEEVFLKQIRLAAELGVPVTIHCLRAWGRLLELLQARGRELCGFLLHSYGGSKEMVRSFVELGGYFSFSGYFAHERKATQREVFRHVPLDRLLLETDAPDMRGPAMANEFSISGAAELNHPCNIRVVYNYYAEQFGHEPGALQRQLALNYEALFGGVATKRLTTSAAATNPKAPVTKVAAP